MKRINLLDENLINQIAAGEVIERPASVVKELVENSVDAGATRIEVEISNECRNMRVADNGHGIHKDDIILAFSRHATSKLRDQDDLVNIASMGFRGEALASVISVAKVTCITKTAEAEAGTKVECENSEIKFSDTGCATGTIMEVRDLFYNIPARLKFLKRTSTELAAISEVVQNLAIANPHISFNLINNKNSILKTSGDGEPATVISEIYSRNIMSEFSEVQKEDEQFGMEITGFVSNPDFTRSNKKAIHTFINKRIIKCPVILRAIDTAYKDMIASGKHPYAVLYLTIPQKEIDINVHPSKKEVKYSNPNLIFSFVYSAVKSALTVTGYAPQPQEETESYAYSAPAEQSVSVATENKVIEFAGFSRQTAEHEEIEQDDIREVVYNEPAQSKFEFTEEDREVIAEKPLIIGQLDNTYILIQTEEGLQIVDQHIAHERYLYEKLKEARTSASQMLLASEELKLDSEQMDLFEENKELLARYGYEFELTESGLKFRKLPQLVAQKDPRKILDDLIKALESSPDTIEDEILIRTSCRAAVKAGEKLSIWQMEELISDWLKTSYPKTCPHGRRIGYTLPKKEIAGFFGRIN